MFFVVLCCVYSVCWNSKQKAKQFVENLASKLQNSIKILPFPVLA